MKKTFIIIFMMLLYSVCHAQLPVEHRGYDIKMFSEPTSAVVEEKKEKERKAPVIVLTSQEPDTYFVEFDFAYGRIWKDNIKISDYHYKYRNDNMINAGLRLRLNDYISYGGFINYNWGRTESAENGKYRLDFGAYLFGVSVYLNAKYMNIEPYIGIGAGFTYTDVKISDTDFSDNCFGLGYMADLGVKTSFYNFVFGVGYKYISIPQKVKNSGNTELGGNAAYISVGYRI